MLTLLLSVLILPADTVTGRIVDTAGHAVPQAIVEVAELGTSVTTSADGTFRLNLAPGRYTLAVRRHGYAPAVREVVLTPGMPAELQIMLTPSAFQLEPLTVTATRQPLPSQSSPLPSTALTGDALRNAQSVSLAHVVATLPGVNAITTGSQIGKPVIRGFAGPRVLVLENGSRLEDYSWSDEDGPSVETAFVRRIELIRGPASVLYGSDAVGGVINVIPDQLPDAGGGRGFMRTGFMVSGATNNVEVAAAGQAEGAKGNFGWRVNAIGRGSGNLHTPDGELDNTGFGALNGDATGGWRWASGSNLAFRVVHYGGEFKLLEANAAPGEEGGPERKAGDNRIQITGQRPLRGGAWRLEGKGQLQAHSLIEVSDDSTGTESEAFNLQLKTASLDVLLHHGGTTLGITGIGQTNDASGREPIVPDGSTISGAAFALQRWSLANGRWALLAGLRGDAQRLSADQNDSLGVVAQDRNAQAWSGNVGLVFMPASPLSLTVNVGRAWRAPTLFELFANGPHIGEARYELGDSTLKPELGGDVDVGLRWNDHRVRFEVSAYYNKLSDFIYVTPTAAVIDSLPVYQYSQAEAEMLGGEAFVEAEVARGFVARGRLEAVRGTNLAAHEPLPLIPPRRAAASVAWRDRVSVEVENYATPTRLNPLDIATEGYTLLNLGGGADLRLFGRDMRLDIQLRNALDERYRSFLSRYKTFADDPGRNLIVRLTSGFID
ncbi:MAG TPA: TonB-dependent receptor [Gemmatimonadales bacterium]|jgi:outer membrane receptor protein involved in Fe transport